MRVRIPLEAPISIFTIEAKQSVIYLIMNNPYRINLKKELMSKDNHLELAGTVTVAGRGIFTVEIDNAPDHTVLARISGKMRQYKINIVVGDRVTVKVSPYDLHNGIIFKREK